MNSIRIFFNVVEIRTKLVSAAVFTAASLAAAANLKAENLPFPWLNWVLMLMATLAVDMGTTGFNTYFDFIHGVDDISNNKENAKVLVHEGVSPGFAFFSSVFLFLTALVLGLILATRCGWQIAALGASSMFVGIFYSAGPRPLSFTPLGELFSGGFLGAVLYGITWYVLTGTFTSAALLYSVPISLMISGILTVNNNCDLLNDKKAGRKTLSILLGLTGGRIVFWVEYISAIILILLMQFLLKIYPTGIPAVTAVLIVLIIIQIIMMERRGYSAETKEPSMQSVLLIYLTGAVLICYPLALIW